MGFSVTQASINSLTLLFLLVTHGYLILQEVGLLCLGAQHFLDFQECIAAATASVFTSGQSEEERAPVVYLAVAREIVSVCGGEFPDAAVIVWRSVRSVSS